MKLYEQYLLEAKKETLWSRVRINSKKLNANWNDRIEYFHNEINENIKKVKRLKALLKRKNVTSDMINNIQQEIEETIFYIKRDRDFIKMEIERLAKLSKKI